MIGSRIFQDLNGEGKSFLKGLSLIGGECGFPGVVDVKNGKIVRIKPLHYDWQYNRKEFNPWKIEARGQIFEPAMKTLLSPFGLAYKKRVYSSNRVLYPLKRVDWDPDGERNTANRGKSRYVRISWNEAVDIIAGELKRIKDQYGPEAVLSQADLHGEGKIVNTTHGCANKLLSLLGGYTIQMRNPDSWEGWVWGAKHAWGMEELGEMQPSGNLIPDIAENTNLLLFWGCDPEVTPWGVTGQLPSRLCYWFKDLGLKSIYICPDLNYGAAVHADKWIPILPNTDAALQLAIAYVWMTEGTYDKEYVATHTYGYEQFAEYVLGQEDGIPKTPAWAAPKCGIGEWTIKALARDWAKKRTTIAHGNGGPAIRSAYATEPARLEVILLAMQGLGKPGVHQAKMIEWMGSSGANAMPAGKISPRMPKFAETLRPVAGVAQQQADVLSLFTTGKPGSKLEKVLTPTPIGSIQFIPKNLIPDAILYPPISWYGNSSFVGSADEQFVRHTYPAAGRS